MDDAQHYCAVINLACFIVFGALALAIILFPGGGRRFRQRCARMLALAAPAKA